MRLRTALPLHIWPLLTLTFGASIINFLIAPPDSTVVAQWLTFLTPVALAVLAVIQMINAKVTTAVKTELTSVKETVVETQKTAVATHTLSNSAMGAQLRGAVEAAEEKVVLFKLIASMRKAPGDDAAVTAAELKVAQTQKLEQEHLVKQATVDATLATSKQATKGVI